MDVSVRRAFTFGFTWRVPLSAALRTFVLLLFLRPACIPLWGDRPSPEEYDHDGDGYTEDEGDCFDTSYDFGCSRADSNDVHPGAPELCNGVDDDCDGSVDEDPETPDVIGFVDEDGDGHGSPDEPILGCLDRCTFCSIQPDPPGDDCDDMSAAVHPGADEQCNGLDDDCDGAADDNGSEWWYADNDGDGYGDPWSVFAGCDPGPGWASQSGDCDDDDATAWPGAPEDCETAIDHDCDGLEAGTDADCAPADDDSGDDDSGDDDSGDDDSGDDDSGDDDSGDDDSGDDDSAP